MNDRRTVARVLLSIALFALAGCEETVYDSMSLVSDDPRLTYANCLYPEGSDWVGRPGHLTASDALQAMSVRYPTLAAEAKSEAERVRREPSRSKQAELSKRFAAKLRRAVTEESQTEEVNRGLRTADVVDGGVAEEP